MTDNTPNERILKHNVQELTEQLYDSYHRIKELTVTIEEVSKLLSETQAERDALQDVVNALAEEASDRLKPKRL